MCYDKNFIYMSRQYMQKPDGGICFQGYCEKGGEG